MPEDDQAEVTMREKAPQLQISGVGPAAAMPAAIGVVVVMAMFAAGDVWVKNWDVTSMLLRYYASQNFDASKPFGGDMMKALGQIKAPALLLPSMTDRTTPGYLTRELYRGPRGKIVYAEIPRVGRRSMRMCARRYGAFWRGYRTRPALSSFRNVRTECVGNRSYRKPGVFESPAAPTQPGRVGDDSEPRRGCGYSRPSRWHPIPTYSPFVMVWPPRAWPRLATRRFRCLPHLVRTTSIPHSGTRKARGRSAAATRNCMPRHRRPGAGTNGTTSPAAPGKYRPDRHLDAHWRSIAVYRQRLRAAAAASQPR